MIAFSIFFFKHHISSVIRDISDVFIVLIVGHYIIVLSALDALILIMLDSHLIALVRLRLLELHAFILQHFYLLH